MRRIILTLSCLCVIAASAPAYAQAAKQVGAYNDWGTYAYDENNSRVCYALTGAREGSARPQNLDHGDIFFLVSQKPGQNVVYEPQFIASYELRENSKVTVAIGDQSFVMFTRGKSAWLENAAEEPQFIAAMRNGSAMQVKATSGRGNATSYEFSLRGVSAALSSITTCK